MGYYITMVDSSFKLKKENEDKALAAIKDMFKPEHLNNQARGGSFNGGGKTASWYSWVDTERSLACKTLAEAIDEWGWVVIQDDNDEIVGLEYESNKYLSL